MNIDTLKGKTLTEVNARADGKNGDELWFGTTEGRKYRMFHEEDCCEQVFIEDICGTLEDLIGSPILQADEESNDILPPKHDSAESYTWTFYRLATIKGSVVIRWYGTSNGFYSESVQFEEVIES